MTNEEQILLELQKINQSLSHKGSGKVAFDNFLAGFFHSFGYLFGTIVIFFAMIFFASRYNWSQVLTKSFETMMSQINWTKIVPTQKIEITSPFSQP